MSDKIIKERFGFFQFEQMEFKNNVLTFINIKTGRIYTCDWEHLLRKDWQKIMWDFSQWDQRLIVWHYLLKKGLFEKEAKESKECEKCEFEDIWDYNEKKDFLDWGCSCNINPPCSFCETNVYKCIKCWIIESD